MPLYGKNGKRIVADCLDRPVVCPLYGTQARAKPVNRLMVRAVDKTASAVERAEKRVIRVCAVHLINAMLLGVSGDVLMQRAAEIDVEELEPAADAENRPALGGKGSGQRELGGVPHLINAVCAAACLPVMPRVNITAAGQQQTVAPCRIASVKGCADR